MPVRVNYVLAPFLVSALYESYGLNAALTGCHQIICWCKLSPFLCPLCHAFFLRQFVIGHLLQWQTSEITKVSRDFAFDCLFFNRFICPILSIFLKTVFHACIWCQCEMIVQCHCAWLLVPRKEMLCKGDLFFCARQMMFHTTLCIILIQFGFVPLLFL